MKAQDLCHQCEVIEDRGRSLNILAGRSRLRSGCLILDLRLRNELPWNSPAEPWAWSGVQSPPWALKASPWICLEHLKCCYWGDWMRWHLELVTKVEEEMGSCHHNPKFWPPRPWFLIGHGDSSQWSSSSSQLGGLSVRHGKGIMEHLYVMGSIDRDCWSC